MRGGEKEFDVSEMIKTFAALGRAGRERQQRVEEKFRKSKLQLDEAPEERLERLQAARDAIKEKNHRRNSIRLEKLLDECRSKRLLELK